MDCPDRSNQEHLERWLPRSVAWLFARLFGTRNYHRYTSPKRISKIARTLLKQQSAIWAAACEYQVFSRQLHAQNALDLQVTRKDVEFERAVEDALILPSHEELEDNSTVFVVTFLLQFDNQFDGFVVPNVKCRTTLQETLLQLTTVAQRPGIGLESAQVLVFPGNGAPSVRKQQVLSACDTLQSIW